MYRGDNRHQFDGGTAIMTNNEKARSLLNPRLREIHASMGGTISMGDVAAYVGQPIQEAMEELAEFVEARERQTGLLDALKGILALGVVPMDDDKTAEFLECIGAAQAAIAKADDARVYKPSGERPFTPEMQAGGVVANIELD